MESAAQIPLRFYGLLFGWRIRRYLDLKLYTNFFALAKAFKNLALRQQNEAENSGSTCAED